MAVAALLRRLKAAVFARGDCEALNRQRQQAENGWICLRYCQQIWARLVARSRYPLRVPIRPLIGRKRKPRRSGAKWFTDEYVRIRILP